MISWFGSRKISQSFTYPTESAKTIIRTHIHLLMFLLTIANTEYVRHIQGANPQHIDCATAVYLIDRDVIVQHHHVSSLLNQLRA